MRFNQTCFLRHVTETKSKFVVLLNHSARKRTYTAKGMLSKQGHNNRLRHVLNKPMGTRGNKCTVED
jgi:hypothetical protein